MMGLELLNTPPAWTAPAQQNLIPGAIAENDPQGGDQPGSILTDVFGGLASGAAGAAQGGTTNARGSDAISAATRADFMSGAFVVGGQGATLEPYIGGQAGAADTGNALPPLLLVVFASVAALLILKD